MNDETKCCCGPADMSAIDTQSKKNADQCTTNRSECDCCSAWLAKMFTSFCGDKGDTNDGDKEDGKTRCC